MKTSVLIRLARRARVVMVRLSDPRAVNPLYVFAGGLGLLLPLWLLFLKP